MYDEAMTIYVNGCTTCGVNSVIIRRIQRDHPEAELKNSRYDQAAAKQHMIYLAANNLPTDSYPPIVVDGDTVTLLRSYQ